MTTALNIAESNTEIQDCDENGGMEKGPDQIIAIMNSLRAERKIVEKSRRDSKE